MRVGTSSAHRETLEGQAWAPRAHTPGYSRARSLQCGEGGCRYQGRVFVGVEWSASGEGSGETWDMVGWGLLGRVPTSKPEWDSLEPSGTALIQEGDILGV